MNLILVRHGETEDNIKGICQGQMPGRLSDKGICQSKLVANALSCFNIDVFYSSDLDRAIKTSEFISSVIGLYAIIDYRLRERDFGPFQGNIMPRDWDGFAQMEGVESVKNIEERLVEFIENLQRFYKGKTILIVGHGVTLSILISILLKCDKSNFDVLKNGSITKIKSNDNKLFKLLEYNNVSHLNELKMD